MIRNRNVFECFSTWSCVKLKVTDKKFLYFFNLSSQIIHCPGRRHCNTQLLIFSTEGYEGFLYTCFIYLPFSSVVKGGIKLHIPAATFISLVSHAHEVLRHERPLSSMKYSQRCFHSMVNTAVAHATLSTFSTSSPVSLAVRQFITSNNLGVSTRGMISCPHVLSWETWSRKISTGATQWREFWYRWGVHFQIHRQI